METDKKYRSLQVHFGFKHTIDKMSGYATNDPLLF